VKRKEPITSNMVLKWFINKIVVALYCFMHI